MADLNVQPERALTQHAPAPQDSSNSLLNEWMSLHQQSTARDQKDNKACGDARDQDNASIDSRTSGRSTTAERVSGDRDDLQGDFQAIGKHKGTHGDDQNNRDADMKIVTLDRQILAKYGSQLSTEQNAALREDIAAKMRTAGNSNSDIAQENSYIRGDKGEMSAVRSGSASDIEAANTRQIELRRQDAALEQGYIADNNRSIQSDDKLRQLFGNFHISM